MIKKLRDVNDKWLKLAVFIRVFLFVAERFNNIKFIGGGTMMQGSTGNNKNKYTGEEDVVYEVYQRCLIIRLNGELDHHNAVRIREEADKLIDRKNIKHIIFDFTATSFMDSAGIGVIMGRYRKVIFIGGKIAVAGVNMAVDRILKISGLYKIIEKYDNVEAALKAMQR